MNPMICVELNFYLDHLTLRWFADAAKVKIRILNNIIIIMDRFYGSILQFAARFIRWTLAFNVADNIGNRFVFTSTSRSGPSHGLLRI